MGPVELNRRVLQGVFTMCELSEAEDSELIRRSRTGETAAFGELVRRYARAAYSVALSVTGTHEDAEDAA